MKKAPRISPRPNNAIASEAQNCFYCAAISGSSESEGAWKLSISTKLPEKYAIEIPVQAL